MLSLFIQNESSFRLTLILDEQGQHFSCRRAVDGQFTTRDFSEFMFP